MLEMSLVIAELRPANRVEREMPVPMMLILSFLENLLAIAKHDAPNVTPSPVISDIIDNP